MLACRENLSKSGGVMHDCSRGSSFRSIRRNAGHDIGHRAGWGFLLAGTVGVLLACGSDDSAPQTGAGGSRGQPVASSADAGRPLPGEGLEPTPDFDITNPQREVPSRQQLVDGISTLYGSGGSGGTPSASDAGAGDAGNDAGAL